VLLQWVEDHQAWLGKEITKNWSSAWEIVVICHKLFVWLGVLLRLSSLWVMFSSGCWLGLLVLSLEHWVEA
jgi:hypothetical protein